MAAQNTQIGSYVLYLDQTDSTNDALKHWLEKEALPHGAALHTAHQTAGRGQQGSQWESAPAQNLLMSIYLKPSFLKAEEHIWLNLSLSLAVRQTLQAYVNEPVQIKWPNDIYIGHKKICGLLLENTLQGNKIKYCIAGIGINVNQSVFAEPKAISLAILLGKEVPLNLLRNQLFAQLTHYFQLLQAGSRNALWEQYHKHLYGKGVNARFSDAEQTFEGMILGIDSRGRLHIEVADEIRSFANKEVTLLNLLEDR